MSIVFSWLQTEIWWAARWLGEDAEFGSDHLAHQRLDILTKRLALWCLATSVPVLDQLRHYGKKLLDRTTITVSTNHLGTYTSHSIGTGKVVSDDRISSNSKAYDDSADVYDRLAWHSAAASAADHEHLTQGVSAETQTALRHSAVRLADEAGRLHKEGASTAQQSGWRCIYIFGSKLALFMHRAKT